MAIRGKLGLLCLSVCAAGLATPVGSVAFATGGSGRVGPLMVGPLRVHVASDQSVRTFAGRPDRVFDTSSVGKGRKLWRYRYPRGRQTSYGFVRVGGDWVLEEFFTSTRRFRTRRETKVGMPYRAARRREPGASYMRAGCLPAHLWYFKEGGFRLQLFLSAERSEGRVRGLRVLGPYGIGCD